MVKKSSTKNPLKKRTKTGKSESHLQKTQKIAQIASWELDLTSGDLSWSDEVFNIFEIPQGTSLSYEGFLQSVLPEDREYVEQKWQAALDGEPYDIEHRIRAGKEIKWLKEKASLEFDKKGRAVRGVGIVQDITAQKAAEQELRRAKINYRMIADYTYNWEWWENLEGTFRYVSPSCERITGYKADRFIENHSLLSEIIVPEDREKWDKHYNESHKDIGLREMQFRIRRPDGEVRWIEHACQPVFTRENEYLGIRASNRDITERKQVGEDLRKSEEKYRDLVDNSIVGVFATTLDGRFIFVNDAMARMYDFDSPEQMVAQGSVARWSDPKHRQQFLAILQKHGSVTNFEAETITHTGRHIHVLFSVKLLGDDLFGMVMDVTERKQAEEALQESREHYQDLYENAPIAYFSVGTDAIINKCNLCATEILGYPREELVGKSVIDLYADTPDGKEKAAQVFQRFLNSNETLEEELQMQRADGVTIWIKLTVNVIHDAEGQILESRSMLVDITERKKAELELKKSLAEIKKLKDLHEKESLYLREEINLEHNYKNIIGNSNAIQYVLFKVEQVAETDSSVLILGETGTGKELIARAIHHNSQRKDRPLIKINCATLPANLIESELFGHERGSFTGAHAKHAGRFEVADGSSIFLDEIGELPIELQAKLLRVIEDGEFERLGSTKTLKVDVRIIAATNRDLEKDIQAERFRRDLWYRLNVFPITLPPLRDRLDDIPLIVQYYVDIFARKLGRDIVSVPVKVVKTLQSYTWPGNVRELANVLERAVISTSGSKLRLSDELKLDHQASPDSFKSLHDLERDYIVKVLKKTNWKVSGKNSAAEILALDRSTLRARMKKLGIHK